MPEGRGVRNAAKNGEDEGIEDKEDWLPASSSSIPFYNDIISFYTVVKLLEIRLI
jgi:hypothetical protein